jgi:5-methyltetrahydropteroyltriglutamate--homocysteine methyltransferase
VFGTVTETDYPSYVVREQFEDVTRLCIDDQERLGFDVISDGQQYYESATPYDYEVMFQHLPTRISGTVPYGPSWDKCNTVVDKLEWVRPIFGPIMEVVSRYTKKPRKLHMFSPTGQLNTLNDQYYKDPEKLAFALADIVNKELKDLVARNLVDIIQFIDASVNYAAAPYNTDVINAATDGVDAEIWLHACQGNSGDRFFIDGSIEFLFPDIYKIKMDQLHIALAHPLRAPDLELFRKYPPPPGLTLGLGVVDVKDPTPEKVDEVVARIERILEVVDPNIVTLMPDCGWMNRRRDTVWDKNTALIEAANIVRERIK